jgi:hypothetical protein
MSDAVFICHPERCAKKRSDRARVEGPLHLCRPNDRSREFSRCILYRSAALCSIRCALLRLTGSVFRLSLPRCRGSRLSLLALLSDLFSVILSEARRSIATERESKDPCTFAVLTTASGNSHRATSLCRISYSLALLSDLFLCHPERSAKKRSDRARVEGPLHFFRRNDRIREFSPCHFLVPRLLFTYPRQRAALLVILSDALFLVIISEPSPLVLLSDLFSVILSDALLLALVSEPLCLSS